MSRAKRIVICGGGAIGVSIAYFLSRRGAQPIVIERHAVAGSASGKSGGFLARDWCRGSALDALARRSFDLHAELADELGNPWSYRRLATYAGHAAENGRVRNSAPRPWLSGRVEITGRLGSPATTALVEPRAFTTGLMGPPRRRARRAARHGRLADAPAGRCRARRRAGRAARASKRTPWSSPWGRGRSSRRNGCRCPRSTATRATASCSNSGDATGAEALFLEYQEASGEVLSPELFPRADGTTWVCAISSTGAMPVDPADVMGDAGAHARLETMCRNISPALGRDADRGAPGVLPAGHRGRLADDRPGERG